jgi:hypothetical protein
VLSVIFKIVLIPKEENSMKAECLFLLKSIIEEKQIALQKYASTPNANQFFIDKENNLIQKLCTIYNSIDEMKYYPIWMHAEDIMKKQMQKTHDNLDGHFIIFKRVENARIDRMAQIELDYFIRS